MSAYAAEIRVHVVDDSPLIREAWSALLNGADGISVVATLASPAESLEADAEAPADIVLMGIFDPDRLFPMAEEIVRRDSRKRLVFLDDRAVDAHVREALRLNAAGYLTWQQPFREIEHALRQVAQGLRVYAPEIASRLVLGGGGLRLPLVDRQTPLARLTPRERDVLGLLSRGYSVKQCANYLGIGVSTAGNHKSRMMRKLDVHKTVQLTHLAIREGLISVSRRSDEALSPAMQVASSITA